MLYEIRKFILFIMMIAASHSLGADCNNTTGGSNNFYFPNFRVNLPAFVISENSAVALIGEIGAINYRVNGTYGLILDSCSRLKITGEYLRQYLGYNFTSGKKHRWMGQFAVGGTYQFEIQNISYLKCIDISGYYSRAKSKSNLRVHDCLDTSSDLTRINRNIAGSDNFNVSLGATLLPWCDSLIHISADYDHVDYRRRFNSHRIVSGFGASVDISQQFCKNFEVRLKGDFRRPYNYFSAELNWHACTNFGSYVLGLFANYTHGMQQLPDIAVCGIQISFWLGRFGTAFVPYNPNLSDCCNSTCYEGCNITDWVSEPAVYVPLVLAIADEKILRNQCAGPVSTPIPSAIIPSPLTVDLDQIASHFTDPLGGQIVFSAVGLPNGGSTSASIDPNTGIITVTNGGEFDVTFAVTVTGTTECGSTSQTFDLTLLTGDS